MDILRNKIGAEVVVTGVPGTGSVKERADAMHSQLKNTVKGRDINLLAHSMVDKENTLDVHILTIYRVVLIAVIFSPISILLTINHGR